MLFLGVWQVQAQFTITDDFKGSGTPDIVIGDDAKFTSGDEDPVNQGWLRLTPAQTNKKGYAFINKTFPSSLGVLIDFEYKNWRDNRDATYNGADGFSIFLFDGTIDKSNFRLGGYGGSLGYAQHTGAVPPVNQGLSGGYIGIGIDEYGNFANPGDGGKNGGPGLRPNSIVLRGPTTNNSSTTNKYLNGVTIKDGEVLEITNNIGDTRFDEIDYNTYVTTRPDNETFYRRVQIEIMPTGTGFYNIVVRWKRSVASNFTQLFSYTTDQAPPSTLKLGFAASTGGGINNHEIRNILVTTPGNLRVTKLVNKDVLRSVPGSGNENEVVYTIEVNNDTPAALSRIDVEDILTDGDNNPIPEGMLSITNISHSGFTSTDLPSPGTGSPITSGSFTGTLGLAANSSGIITVTGKLNEIPVGNLLQNTVTIKNDEITDQDLENNTSTVRTPVYAEGVDLVIKKSTDEECLDMANGNSFTLTVSNVGINDLQYSQTNQIIVREELPAGATMSNRSSDGWSYSVTGNTHTFIRNGSGTLRSGRSAPPITFKINSSSGYTNTAEVELSSNSGTNPENIEPPENQGNNTDSVIIGAQPSAPGVTSPLYYCKGDVATSLVATTTAGNILSWYTDINGVPLNNAPVPNTNNVGSVIYYVSQTNGNCESELAEIEVIVLEKPEPGSIAGIQEICGSTQPTGISSVNPGTGFGTISYRWEFSEDEGTVWEEIDGAHGATFQPSIITKSTTYRRITVATNADGYSCESVPTNEVTVTTKNCKLFTNPMLPSKAKQ